MYRVIGVILLIGPLAACASLSISQPTAGEEVCPPVKVEVDWSSNLEGPLSVLQDGSNVSQQFTINTTARKATAALEMPEGAHSLQASGTFSCWYCGGASALSASTNFTARCPRKK